jgi:hypothetical protein
LSVGFKKLLKYRDLKTTSVMAAAGMCAAGVAGLHAQNVTGLTRQETSKRWLVEGALRAFYDDNSLNAPEGLEDPSFGFELSPGFSVNLPGEQTLFTAGYRLTLSYYEARPENNFDQTHQFDALLNHKFSERYNVNAEDSFVYSNEPQVLEEGGAQTTFQRSTDQSGLRNYASIDFNARLTPITGLSVGYKNNFRDYDQTGTGSLSALLDQVEHLFHFDGQWYPAQPTILLAGYEFGLVEHTSEDPLGIDPSTFEIVFPEERNSLSHYLYIGGTHDFSRQLEGKLTVGVEYRDYYNRDETSLGPKLDLQASYTYLPESVASLGLKVARNSTDAGLGADGDLTLDQQSTVVFASVDHRITSRIKGSLLGHYQYSVFNGGDFDNQSDDYFIVNLNLSYKIREHVFAELGYSWWKLLSSRPNTEFTRNRVYAGIRASY